MDTCLDALSVSTHRFVVICHDYVSTAAAATTTKGGCEGERGGGYEDEDGNTTTVLNETENEAG